MSLEEALAANTKALEALTAVLGLRISAAAADPAADMFRRGSKTGVIEEKKTDPKTETKPPATSPTSENTSSESEPVKYDDVKKLILAISKNDRNKAVALLGHYGAKGGLELKPEQFADFAADAGRVLSGEYDPEQGDE